MTASDSSINIRASTEFIDSSGPISQAVLAYSARRRSDWMGVRGMETVNADCRCSCGDYSIALRSLRPGAQSLLQRTMDAAVGREFRDCREITSMREERVMREDDRHSLRAECCAGMSDRSRLVAERRRPRRNAMVRDTTRERHHGLCGYLDLGCCLRSSGLPYAADVAVRVRTFTC
jgi:hypothetical protein